VCIIILDVCSQLINAVCELKEPYCIDHIISLSLINLFFYRKYKVSIHFNSYDRIEDKVNIRVIHSYTNNYLFIKVLGEPDIFSWCVKPSYGWMIHMRKL
jgi:hypothetical protein